MVQASGRAHLFTIFIKSSPCFIRCKKEFNSNTFFCYNEGRKIRQEIDMSEPLFLQSVMQEKIWGGAKLRDEFGYDIPSEKIGEYWAI
ncbi:hypothetical protein PNI0008_02064, partial [Streptococcus pneumoniae PNI0008]